MSVRVTGAAVLLLLAVLSATPLAATGPVDARAESIVSANVPWPVRVTVILPPSYGASPDRRYPVVYFLHDAQENERALLSRGVAAALHAAMREGSLKETIVVAPFGKDTWFVDSFDGRLKYDTFLTRELVPFVESHYRALSGRATRAAIGISMGGYGVLHWAFLHPELFAAVGGLSPAVQTMNWKTMTGMPFFLRPTMKRIFGASETANAFVANDLYDRLLSDRELAARLPRVILRCGTNDRYRLAELSTFFRSYLKTMGVSAELTLEPGVHEWSYWKTALPKVWASVSEGLR